MVERISDSILETIGRTPLIQLNRIAGGLRCRVVAKTESRNPGGSVKDRIALSMIKKAEELGLINNETVIVEPT
ncbi:MAG: pyridoxal-phosphate dependent enzyme, partial [Candidatus Bathyarchaeota archaeon]